MLNTNWHLSHTCAIADDQIEPVEAVRSYHNDLQRMKIRPRRELQDDLQPTVTALNYSGSTTAPSSATASAAAARASAVQRKPAAADQPDFSNMTAAEKVEWNLARWRRILD